MGHAPAAIAAADGPGQFDHPSEAHRHERAAGERPARRVHRGLAIEAEGIAQDDLLRAVGHGQLGDVHRAVVQAHPIGRDAHRRGVGQVPQRGVVRIDAVVDGPDPHRVVAQLPGLVGSGDDHGRGSVAGGRAVEAAQRLLHVGLGQQLVHRQVAAELGVGVVLGVGMAAGYHLGEVPLGGLARRDERLGLETRLRARVEADGGMDVGVGLEREPLPIAARRAFARARHQHGVDISRLESHEPLEQGPGAVHLHVALIDGRPRPHRVDVHDEGERHPRQVVAAPRDGEVDVVAVHPHLLDHRVHARHDHGRLAVVEVGVGGGLLERDDGHVFSQAYHECSFNSSAGMSGSPVGSNRAYTVSGMLP